MPSFIYAASTASALDRGSNIGSDGREGAVVIAIAAVAGALLHVVSSARTASLCRIV